MATTPDLDLATYLGTQIGALTLGTNLFVGKTRAVGDNIPSKAVFCLATGGPTPQAYMDGTAVEERPSMVQARIRSEPRDFDGGQTLARLVRDTAHHASISGYIDVEAQQAEPFPIGEDAKGHHEWSINFRMLHEQ
jgi:hypothetical protein